MPQAASSPDAEDRASRPVPRGRWSRWRLIALIALALAGVFGAGLWIAAAAGPGWVREAIEQEGRKRLGRAVTLQAVELDLLALRVGLRGLRIDGATPEPAPASSTAPAPALFEAAALEVDIDGAALWRGRLALERVHLLSPKGHVTRFEDGRWDIDDVVQRLGGHFASAPAHASAAPQAPRPGVAVLVRDVAVRDGQWVLDDRLKGQRHAVTGLSLAVPRISTQEADRETPIDVRLSLQFNGAPLQVQASARPWAAVPLGSASVQLHGLDLSPAWGHLGESLPVRLRGGRIGADVHTLAERGGPHGWQWQLSGQLAIEDLAVHHPGGARLAAWQSLTVALQDVRPLERQADLGAVVLNGAEVDIRRDARGRLDVLSLATPSAAPAPAPAPWAVRVASVALRGARVQWRDAATTPAAAFSLDPLDLTLGPLQWPSAPQSAPWPLALRARVNEVPAHRPGAVPLAVGRVSIQGQVDDRQAALDWQFDDLQLSAAPAYVRPLLSATLGGVARGRGRVAWSAGERPHLRVSAQELSVSALSVIPAGDAVAGRARAVAIDGADAGSSLRVAQLTVQEVRADVQARRVSVGSVALQRPAVRLRRLDDGQLAGLTAMASTTTPQAAAPPTPSGVRPPGWQGQLAALRTDGGTLEWIDEAVPRTATGAVPARLALREIDFTLRELAWPVREAAIPVALALQLPAPAAPGVPPAAPGRLELTGRITPTPLAWSGAVRLERWPLHAFEPYVAGRLPVRLNRAELGLQAQLQARLTDAGPVVQARGQALLADVLVQTPDAACAVSGACAFAAVDNDDTLAAWNALSVLGLELDMQVGQRPRVKMDEVRLADFFARLLVTPEGRLNLQKLAPPGATTTPAPPAGANPWPFDLVVERTLLVNGRVDFQDRFIRPNFAADLSDLHGTIGRIESAASQMATVELRGRAARTALLEIRGAVNPTANPLALDLSVRATDLELAPLSAYSGKYAGYAIERGKLSVDLAYRVDPDGRLQARNQIILNQLTLGDKVDSPSATTLPVRLALYLLADRHGVIDVDLPVSGSINDPQFSLWGIVWKVIGNLIVKVVTAPLAWLTGGGGPDASQVEFLAGTDRLADSAAAVMDKVARALTDRPRLRMTVTGAADPQVEREAIQQAVFESRLRALQERDRARSGGDAAAATPGPAPLGAAPREELVKRLFAQTAPAASAPPAAALTPQVMETQLKAAIPVTPQTARELALQRGLAVRDALIARGLPAERLFLAAPKVRSAEESEPGWLPRVQLSLEGPP